MSRVFVVEHTSLDLSTTAKFGDVYYIFQPDDRRSSIFSDEFSQEVLEKLRGAKFDPRKDYFAVVGHMVPVALTIITLCYEWTSLRLLLYSSTERRYVEKEMTYDDAEGSN